MRIFDIYSPIPVLDQIGKNLHRIVLKTIGICLIAGVVAGIPIGYVWHKEAVVTNESVLKTELKNAEDKIAKLRETVRKYSIYPDPDVKPILNIVKGKK